MIRQNNSNVAWDVAYDENKTDMAVIDYQEDKNIFLNCCVEHYDGKNHTEFGFVLTRALNNYWLFWWHLFVNALVNKLYYLIFVLFRYDSRPK